ncbi:MAG: hypothetical protein HC763_29640 [Hydrococcus sp. CRU_1_1]|nr:hypothetical protein [Hydrococcus sp. CRU_1_1]
MTAQEPQLIPKKKFQRFDSIVLASILVLFALIFLVLWQGDRVDLRVNEFSWKNKIIGVQDRWFSIKFNRPVNRESIEKNLTIAPSIAGKIHWIGEKLVYTLAELPIYGNNYQIILKDAKSLDGDREIEPYFEVFKSRDRALVYMGLADKERGQLILVNVTQKTKAALTPRDLVVTNFKIYPNSNKILFSAFERGRGNQRLETQQLYTVTTGLNFQGAKKTERLGKVKLVLDAKAYKNFKFDLSNDGKTIVVSRINRNNPAESSLWVIPEEESPRPLGLPGNNFLIAPNGNRVAVAQRGGIAMIPLNPEAGETKFFPGYETIVGFSKDGSQKFMVKDNLDYTRSLVLVKEDGTAKELFQTLAPVVNCELEPREEKILYCLKLRLVQREEQQVNQEAYLAAIDLETTKEIPLLVLPNYQDVEISMSPDGIALLFDQIATTFSNSNTEIATEKGEAIVSGRLWLLTLPELATIQTGTKPPQVLPEELDSGFKPQWIP